MKSREKFAQEVADVLKKEHSRHKESFIFGISGKWGEGKTYFLKLLETKLDKFSIVRINPWKFSGDRVAFLRYFLQQLRKVKGPKKSKVFVNLHKLFQKETNDKKKIFQRLLKEFLYELSKKRDFLVDDVFKKLDHDETKYSFDRAWSVVILIYFLLFFLVYLNIGFVIDVLPKFVRYWIFENLSAITFFVKSVGLIAVTITFLGKLITVQVSKKAVSTLDEFDSILDKILVTEKSNKLAIFIDDLDRVTPETARNVLDNLRTFFDKPDLSFVVTGDHSVLERYIGAQTLPNGGDGEKLEEGRRFLKKIFNYYWRLPVPIDQEFKNFIDEKFIENKQSLNVFFNKNELDILGSYLGKYFEKNFRQIQRFIDTIIFTFKIIDLQLEDSTDDNKKYFDDLKRHPLLVVRILMIQDLCTPLFEEMLKTPSIVFELEYSVEKSDNEKIDKIIDSFGKKLSLSRKSFISKFLFEKPRFYDNSRLTVLAIEPFLYYSADAGFGDLRGPLPSDFTASLQTGDTEQIKQFLLGSGDLRINGASDSVVKIITESSDKELMANLIRFLLSALLEIPVEHPSQQIFYQKFKTLNFNSIIVVDKQINLNLQTVLWNWLNIQNKDFANEYLQNFTFTNIDDFDAVDYKGLNGGWFSSRVVTQWLVNFYKQNKKLALEKMSVIFPELDKTEVLLGMEEIKDEFCDDLINISEDDITRDKRFEVSAKFINDGTTIVKEKVFSAIQNRNEDIWQWASTKSAAQSEVWTQEILQKQLIIGLENISDPNILLTFIDFCANKIDTDLKSFWDKIINNKFELLTQSFKSIVDNQNIMTLTPNANIADLLYKKITMVMSQLGDEDKMVELLNQLSPDKWIWHNCDIEYVKKCLTNLRSRLEKPIGDKVDAILNLWDMSVAS